MTKLRLIKIGKKYSNTGSEYIGQNKICDIENCGSIRIENDMTLTIVLSKKAIKELKQIFNNLK
jgi:hypothetical protein